MFKIEAEWLGYTNPNFAQLVRIICKQDHVVHREYTYDKKFVEALRKIGPDIIFTDGTRLRVTIEKIQRKLKKFPEVNGYRNLLYDCAKQQKNKVDDLYHERNFKEFVKTNPSIYG
jgi:hypothetical protein